MSSPEHTRDPLHEFQDSVSRDTYILDRRTMEQRMGDIELKQVALQRGLDTNTATTERVEKSVGEVVEAFKTFQYGFKALNTLAKVITPIVTVVTAIGGMYLFFRGGGK